MADEEESPEENRVRRMLQQARGDSGRTRSCPDEVDAPDSPPSDVQDFSGTAVQPTPIPAPAPSSVAPARSVNSAEAYDWSVRVFPPSPLVLPTELFVETTFSSIVHFLGAADLEISGESYTWPQRGWRGKQEFDQEVASALARPDASVVGIVIARAQTRQQAERLAAVLVDRLIQASAENVGNPVLSATGVRNAPSRSSGSPRSPGRAWGQEEQQQVERLLRMTLYDGNKAPPTSKTVRDSLPRFKFGAAPESVGTPNWWVVPENMQERKPIYDLNDMKECTLCMDTFGPGEDVTFLPCGHCYHLGAESENDDAAKPCPDDACKGLTHWLELNHYCPICRLDLPVDKDSRHPEPVVSAQGRWQCPLCIRSNSDGNECPCGVRQNALGRARSGDVDAYFSGIEELFRQVITAPRPLGGSQKNVFDTAKRRLLTHQTLQRLEMEGWEVTTGITNLLEDAMVGAREITVTSGGSDRNSLAVIAVLVDRLRTVLAEASTMTSAPTAATAAAATDATAVSTVTPVQQITIGQDYNFDGDSFVSRQSRSISPVARGFLKHHGKILMMTARMIVKGGRAAEWEAVCMNLLPKFEQTGWALSQPVRLMKAGVRDYAVLTSECRPEDVNSRVVIEALLEMITNIQDDQLRATLRNSPAAAAAFMQRSNSGGIGSNARTNLESLQTRLSPEAFHKSVDVAVKLIDNLRCHPGDEKFRKLKKTNPALQACIFAHSEMVALFEAIGFADDGGEYLHLKHIQEMDQILRTLQILRSYLRS